MNGTSASDPPLGGMRVLDISTYVAGPSGTQILAQLGAEVIRIDPIGGATDSRRLPLGTKGESLYWDGLNRAKKSVEIDTKTESGRQLIYSLLERSGDGGGIVMTNAVGRNWLSYESLKEYRSDLIHVRVAGHSDNRPAVDYTVNCEVGLPLMTGPPDLSRPVNHVLPAWDLLTGLHAAVGILVADRVRRETGCGQQIEVALADVAAATMGQLGFIADAVLNGNDRLRDGNYLYGSFGCDFTSCDGRHLMVVALTERHWRNLVELTGAKEVISALERATGSDFRQEEARYRMREVIAALLSPWFERHSSRDISKALDEGQVLWGTYRTVSELVNSADSLLADSRIFEKVEDGSGHSYPVPRSVLSFGDWPGRGQQRTARIGENTDEVIESILGYGPEKLEQLRNDGLIGGPS